MKLNLDRRTQEELKQLSALINAYAMAGTSKRDKAYTRLPSCWRGTEATARYDGFLGQYVLCESTSPQELILTPYGLMARMQHPYKEGVYNPVTLARELIFDLTTDEGYKTPSRACWPEEELRLLFIELDDLEYEPALPISEQTLISRARQVIINSLILGRIDKAVKQDEFDAIIDADDKLDVLIPELQEMLTGDETYLAEEFTNRCIAERLGG